LLWDVGTGHGAIAIAAAQRGLQVIATDISPTALARAKERAGDARITWVRDDVTASTWLGQADVIVDRGTLHTLPLDRREAYARTIASHSRTGTLVLVTTYVPPLDPRARAHPMSSDEVGQLLGDAFERIEHVEGTFAGRLVPPPQCVTTVLRRR